MSKKDKLNPSIKIIPFPEIENAYIVISAKISDKPNGVEKNMSFFIDCGNGKAVEWEPNYGPITVLHKCDKNDPQAQPHWYFDYCTGYRNWSQLAVKEERLPEDFLYGDYKCLFNKLFQWGI